MTWLPQVSSVEEYKKLFKEDFHWEKAVSHLAEKHQLKGPVQRGQLGSHIVYRVGRHWIKMMAPMFVKDMDFEISGLRAVDGKLSVQTPQIVADGILDQWHYIIVTHIEGQPIREIWKTLDRTQKTHLTKSLASVTAEIKNCKPDQVIQNRFVWNEFIQNQYENCEAQQTKKSLPEPWINNLKKFLKKFSIEEFKTAEPVLIHADLTYDHYLIKPGDAPQVAGIIDMADCQVGHPEYELVAPCTFIFHSDRELLSLFLKKYGIQENKLDSQFSEKLVAWLILHRYFSFISYFKNELNQVEAGDFSALARLVFPLNN